MLVVAAVLAVLIVAGQAAYAKEEAKAKVELPDAVAKALATICPNAKITVTDAEQETEEGVTVFDIEFTAGTAKMEADIAADGTILETSAVVGLNVVPEAAAKAIKAAAEGATIKQVERAEIRAEIKKGEGGKGAIVMLQTPRVNFEAELTKGDQEGEITVAADGTVVEPLKWKKIGEKDVDSKGEAKK
jgi:hypothetical protein